MMEIAEMIPDDEDVFCMFLYGSSQNRACQGLDVRNTMTARNATVLLTCSSHLLEYSHMPCAGLQTTLQISPSFQDTQW